MRVRRCLFVLLALAFSLELAAQVVPDTTSPARYAPLGVGDVWHYYDDSVLSTVIQARRVLRDSTVNDTTYAVVEVYTDLGARWNHQTSARTELLRFDSTRAVLRQRNEYGEYDASYAPCALDAPFPGPNGAECYTDGEWTGWVVRGGYEETIHIGDSVRVGPVKSFDSLGGWAVVAADIGIVGWGGDGSPISTLLAYAFVGGKTYGAPLEGLPGIQGPAPWQYVPLAVGNVWEYEFEACSHLLLCTSGVQRFEITGDSLINGESFFVRIERDLRDTNTWSPARQTNLVRFDTTMARVVVSGGSGPSIIWMGCSLNGDSTAGSPCTEVQTPPYVGVSGRAKRAFSANLHHVEVYELGVGYVGGGVGDSSSWLTYARIDGQEYGQPVPVASPASPTTAPLTLTAFPSPTRGPLTLALDNPAPGPVELAAFDALGRRVWHTERAGTSGRQRVEIDASAWAPGLYIIRALTRDASATTTVVRR